MIAELKPDIMIFMLFLMLLFASAMDSAASVELSMMDQSVDDMYSDCIDKMAEKVKGSYFLNEMKKNELFKKAWDTAAPDAKKKFDQHKEMKLTIDHIQAISVYTNNALNIYEPFNNAVRNSRNNYNTEYFQYHALHFWLTSAIQILAEGKCYFTYRRSKAIFMGMEKQVFRFGSFTSASMKNDLVKYGEETCFYIKTCYGAYVKDYSVFQEEEEVLIPPYEVFKIISIVDKYKNLKNCKKIFIVEHAGHLSNLNCRAIN